MKRTLFLLPLAALLSCAAHAAGPQQTARTPLRPISACIRLDQINEWHVVDPRTALVRTGPYRYQVKLQNDCPRLGIGVPGLLFRPNESNKLVGQSRICGEVGETVQARNQPPCAIASVSKIDKAQFDSLSKQAPRHGSAADMPTTSPPK
ncbi:DUF6491 family protein [Frateuria defendens]|uniref:DUF6491 family protein n=1 Tax=Frateuria defendens TaxID=2219559 RepID=UPI00066FB48A|nr:DUF6491 family protein [Frateuria defendens]